MIGNISKSKAQKGDPLTFDMLTEAEKASLSPKPDWNQTDETKADFIKNKPDLTKYATKEAVSNSIAMWKPNNKYEVGDVMMMLNPLLGSSIIGICTSAYTSPDNLASDYETIGQHWDYQYINAAKALSAMYDDEENLIRTTYATKEELNNVGGGNITVDSVLDENSENPVQNKVITQMVNRFVDDISMLGLLKVNNIAEYSNDENYPTTGAVDRFVAGKIGDIETALDSIIAIQNGILGVSE